MTEELPKTLQAMKDYVAYAKQQIKRNDIQSKRLNEAISELLPKITNIENQEGVKK